MSNDIILLLLTFINIINVLIQDLNIEDMQLLHTRLQQLVHETVGAGISTGFEDTQHHHDSQGDSPIEEDYDDEYDDDDEEEGYEDDNEDNDEEEDDDDNDNANVYNEDKDVDDNHSSNDHTNNRINPLEEKNERHT